MSKAENSQGAGAPSTEGRSPPSQVSEARRLQPWTLLYGLWFLFLVAVWIAGPFLAAGTLRWAACWLYFAALGAGLLLHGRAVARRNPALRERRKRVGAGTKTWDKIWNSLFWPLMIAVVLIAGFGVRFGWAAMPAGLFAVGAALLAAGLSLSAWAMSVNPHFEGTVRIQSDIGHRVIDQGPYRSLRHPGYAGLALWALATPFLLLSWRALFAAGAVVAWVGLRTALEDRLLRRELSGYEDYAQRVRFRLVPGLW